MKKIIVLFFFLGVSLNVSMGQQMNEEEKEVYDIIIKLFDGMRAGDSMMVHSVFSDDCRMYSNFINEKGINQNRIGSLKGFLEAIGTPHDQVWDEKIWNTKVDVELGVAQVWTEYAFFAGDKFSHCGIDAIQLIREKGDWKIIQIIDTRQKEDCELPDFNK
jgi:hypothetical protein